MTSEYGPDPSSPFPFQGLGYSIDPCRTVFLKNIITLKNVEVGDYTYYDDPDVRNFEKNILYHYYFSKEKLIIGKFCALAAGLQFTMGGAHHNIEGFSSYPFPIFKHGWDIALEGYQWPSKGDTVIGNDVWVGYGSMILSGVHIGDGVIIGTRSVVTRDVEPYTIVGGNPAKVIRKRYDDETIATLLKIKWWDWPIEKITKNLKSITGNDLKALIQAADLKN